MAERQLARLSLADLDNMMRDGTQETLHNLPKCAVCNKIETAERKLFMCSRCKNIKYCSKGCQTESWPTHKSKCKAENYILKVDLNPENITNPSVSRTLSCPANATFESLHFALQTAFGWSCTHSYDFKIKDPNAEQEPE